MSSTTIYRRGQVVVVEVPFSDFSGTKRRPALVISADTFHRTLPDVIVCPISSQARFYTRPSHGDCPLKAWRQVGLRRPSTARLSKLLAIDKAIIKKTLGALSSDDLVKVEQGVRKVFGVR